MQFLTSPLVWLLRIRKRCGYGIHSPYAFRFVTGVLYEKLPYWPFNELDAKLPFWYRFRMKKHLRMLFRIANHVQPRTAYISSPIPQVEEYVKAGCNKVHFLPLSDANQLDFCFLSAPDNRALEYLHQGSVLILDNLRLHRQWFLNLPSVVSYDLWDVGIAFFDTKYNKQHYIINF